MSAADELLAELDLTALADAVGVLRAGPTEPSAVERERGQAIRRARQRRIDMQHSRHRARAFDRAVGTPTDIGREARSRRELANALAALGFSVEYLSRRFTLAPKRDRQ